MAHSADTGKVHIVDPDADTRAGVHRLLASLGYPLTEYATVESFLASRDARDAGCVVIDHDVAGGSAGLALLARLHVNGSPVGVVFLSHHADVPTAVAAMRAGAAHFLVRPVREQQLLEVVSRTVRASVQHAEQAAVRRTVLSHLSTLTERERQVLEHLIEGAPYDVVSGHLGITKRTVEAHRRRIMEKMGVRTLPQLLQQLSVVDGRPVARH
jgi:FixJ family two-component response regulator